LVNHLPAIGGKLRIDVADSRGQRILATHAQLLRPNDRQISLPFSVPEGGSVDLEVRYWHDGLSDVTVQHVSISRKDAEDLSPALGRDSPIADTPLEFGRKWKTDGVAFGHRDPAGRASSMLSGRTARTR
jgi:hypothetical protein